MRLANLFSKCYVNTFKQFICGAACTAKGTTEPSSTRDLGHNFYFTIYNVF